MKKRANKRLILTIVGITLVVTMVVVGSILFMDASYDMVHESVLSQMKELVDHDKIALTASIDQRYETLLSFAKRMRRSREEFASVEEFQQRLVSEVDTTPFGRIAFVTSEYTFYASDYSTGSLVNGFTGLYQKMTENPDGHFMMNYQRSGGIVENAAMMLMYGQSLPKFSICGVEFCYIFGESEIYELQNEVRIVSFDGRGHTGLVNHSGYYVINPKHADATNIHENLLQRLDPQRNKVTYDGVLSVLSGKADNFHGEFVEDNEEYHLYIEPIDNADFFVCLEVSAEVFREMRSNYLTPAFVFVTVAVMSLSAVIIGLYYTRRSAMHTQAVAEAKTTFLSTMSHEIRTPLNGIIGLNYLMKKNFNNKNKMSQYISETSETAQYLLSLVNDILDFSKLNSGKFTVYHEPYNLNELVSNISAMQRDNAKSRGIKFIVKSEISTPWVLGDHVRIKQVLMNIIGNAMKFTPQGGIIEFVTAQQNADDGVKTVFTVKDTGCGMSDAYLEHIFEAFSQERNSAASEQKGTGLGMSISYLLVKEMGGDISVTSKLNIGSTFVVSLPTEEAVDVVPEHVEEVAVDVHNTNILLAEDNELNMMIMVDILEGEGFHVECAENGQVALDMFVASEENHFDVILMDMQMPVLDGCEAAKKIRASGRPDAKSVKIYACTANNFKEDVDRIFESGMDDYLPKPINVPMLLQKLKNTKR